MAKVVLVLGSTGVAGSAIKSLVSSEEAKADETWIFACSKDGDLTNNDETRSLLEKYNPTHVINLAAKAGGLYSNIKNNLRFFRANFQIYDNVMHNCYELGIANLITCSSTCVFQAKEVKIRNEDMIHVGEPCEALMGYSFSKRMIDVLNRLYFKQHGISYTSCIPSSIFGPHDNYNLESGGVLAVLIHKTYLAKKNGTSLVVYGSGAARRQFIYCLDFARLVIWMMREYNEVAPIILTVDEVDEVSIRDLVRMITQSFDFKGKVEYDTTKSDGQLRRTCDNSKLRKYRPDFQFTPIEKAIKETCEWFERNYETVRK